MEVGKKLNPFDFVNSINTGTKNDLMASDPEAEKSYLPFIINRQMSYFQDTVMIANEMNASSKLESKLQYDFYRHTVRPKKRFAKWTKPDSDQEELLKLISEYYGISKQAALPALKILSKEAIDHMRSVLDRGGVS
jgi:hypothetical protein